MCNAAILGLVVARDRWKKVAGSFQRYFRKLSSSNLDGHVSHVTSVLQHTWRNPALAAMLCSALLVASISPDKLRVCRAAAAMGDAALGDLAFQPGLEGSTRACNAVPTSRKAADTGDFLRGDRGLSTTRVGVNGLERP
jgi:hypothetical protein